MDTSRTTSNTAPRNTAPTAPTTSALAAFRAYFKAHGHVRVSSLDGGVYAGMTGKELGRLGQVMRRAGKADRALHSALVSMGGLDVPDNDHTPHFMALMGFSPQG